MCFQWINTCTIYTYIYALYRHYFKHYICIFMIIYTHKSCVCFYIETRSESRRKAIHNKNNAYADNNNNNIYVHVCVKQLERCSLKSIWFCYCSIYVHSYICMYIYMYTIYEYICEYRETENDYGALIVFYWLRPRARYSVLSCTRARARVVRWILIDILLMIVTMMMIMMLRVMWWRLLAYDATRRRFKQHIIILTEFDFGCAREYIWMREKCFLINARYE